MDEVKSDPRYIQGKDLMKAGEFEKAIEFFGQLLEVSVSSYGEMAPQLACVYYEYGAALLAQSQEATDVFGAAIKNAQKAQKAAEEAKDGATNPETEDPETTEEDVQEDLELAWQNLELARVLFQAEESQEGKLMLAEVFLKLADLNTLNGNFTQAIDDYKNSLQIRQSLLEPHNRILAEVHFNLANTYEYFFAAEKEKNPEYTGDQQSHALEHYEAVEGILKKKATFLMNKASPAEEKAENGGEGSGKGKGKGKAADDFVISTEGLEEEDRKEVEEIKEILEEVKETIEAKRKEVAEGAPSVKDTAPQTSIGFGQSSTEQAANVLPASTLQVKRKSKDQIASSKTSQPNNSSNLEEQEEKKIKTDQA